MKRNNLFSGNRFLHLFCGTKRETIQLSLCVFGFLVGFESTYNLNQREHVALSFPDRIQRKRNPEIKLGGETKCPRHYAYDGVRLIIECESAADNLFTAAKASIPQSLAN